MRTRFCGSNFLGIWFPQNLGYFRISQAEEEGSGEESSACSIRFILAEFGADKNTEIQYCASTILLFLRHDLKGSILGIRLGHFR